MDVYVLLRCEDRKPYSYDMYRQPRKTKPNYTALIGVYSTKERALWAMRVEASREYSVYFDDKSHVWTDEEIVNLYKTRYFEDLDFRKAFGRFTKDFEIVKKTLD